MGLRLGGTGADGGPGDQVAVVLRRDRVERLGAGGQAEFVDLEQKFTGLLHADVDAEAVVHEGVVDVALPADRGPRLFEIDPHDDLQHVADLVGQGFQTARIVEAGHGIMNRAGADDYEYTRVLAVENLAQQVAAVGDGVRRLVGNRQPGVDFLGGGHGVEGAYVQVLGILGHLLSSRIMSLTACTLSFKDGQWRKREILSCPANL
ncbi:hypothetical protein SDC9_183088 [bioreactor metagenome]|uniref:Uncharacterized protein n=1 Tax=bioreactor metagenome TaxID=1076179 RepID=A0A645HA42_9ZZZZ